MDVVPEVKRQTKTCIVCRQTKPISDFYAKSRKCGGFFTECKECFKERVRINYAHIHNFGYTRGTVITQEVIGKKLGITPQGVSVIERRALKKLAKAFRILEDGSVDERESMVMRVALSMGENWERQHKDRLIISKENKIAQQT